MMRPGEWVSVDGYDGENVTAALVTATSTHKAVIRRADANRLIAEAGLVHTRDVTWRSVRGADYDEIGDDCEFHEHGSGRRLVEASLCGPPEGNDG